MSQTHAMLPVPPNNQKKNMHIKLRPLDGMLLTAYTSGGRTRVNGRPPPSPYTVQQAASPGWRMAAAAAVALRRVDHDVSAAGGARIRLVDVWRDPNIQGKARAKYERWVGAGKPEPGTRRYDSRSMKAAYVARAGESNHGWGGAVDIDDGALEFPGTGLGTDAALAVFWVIAAKHGFTPIIRSPIISQSESWHFDWIGPLEAVNALSVAHGGSHVLVSQVGSILAGTIPTEWRQSLERYVQARLLVGGYWCGAPDGILGIKTRAALQAAGITVAANRPASDIISALNAAGVGLDVIEAINSVS